jgi:hypothetical protein
MNAPSMLSMRLIGSTLVVVLSCVVTCTSPGESPTPAAPVAPEPITFP